VAILSDSIHDLGDSLSLGLSWWLENYAERSSDQRFSYGYRRFSLLGALISTTVLIGGSLLVLAETIPRLMNPEQTNAAGMAVFALVGIIVNGVAVLCLRRGQTLNTQVVAWHLLEDVLGWVAVFIVGVTLLIRDLPILDPILSILITGYVLYNVARNLRSTLSLFLQAVPEEIELEHFEAQMRSLPKVLSTHHTHVWSLDGQHHVLTAHIVVPDGTSTEEIFQLKCDLRDLSQELSLEHTTFEIEYQNEECGMRPTPQLSEDRQPQ
jgi:cobalt-zinc-cadmium efflux system protein